MSNEAKIRKACKKHFKKKYENIIIKDEFSQQNIFVRPDLFGVTENDTISIEIKSNKDSFLRMERQLIGYLGFSSLIYVVLDRKHVKKFMKYFGNKNKFFNIGVMYYKKGSLKTIREPVNRKVPLLYNMLWRDELIKMFYLFKNRSFLPNDKDSIKEIIEDIFTYKEIKLMSKKIFFSRMRKTNLENLYVDIDFVERQNKYNLLMNKI